MHQLTRHEYYKINILIPLLDHLVSELESRFSDQAAKSVQSMNVLPIVLLTKGCTKLAEVMQIYIDDLPSPMTMILSTLKYMLGKFFGLLHI